MEKINIGSNAFVYPMPVSLVGAIVDGRPNFMAVGWVCRVNRTPPIIAVAINQRHLTPKGIQEHRTFSVNFPGLDLMEKTDYCGLVSGREKDKSGIFEIFYGELKTAPMIQECPLCLECKLLQIVPLPTNSLFLGEIVAAFTEDRFLTNGKPDIQKMKSFVLTMPDNNYWKVGEHAGHAWSIGRKLKQE